MRPFFGFVTDIVESLTDFTKDVIKSAAIAYVQR